jgi:hypothetical protein
MDDLNPEDDFLLEHPDNNDREDAGVHLVHNKQGAKVAPCVTVTAWKYGVQL